MKREEILEQTINISVNCKYIIRPEPIILGLYVNPKCMGGGQEGPKSLHNNNTNLIKQIYTV